MKRKRYTPGHVIEDFIADDRDGLAAHTARNGGGSVLDRNLPFGRLASGDIAPNWVPREVLIMRSARARSDWATADAARRQLAAIGWEARTQSDGAVEWQRNYAATTTPILTTP